MAFPEFWKPIIGWAMNKFFKGSPVELVFEELQESPRFGFLDPFSQQQVIAQAQQNVAATQAAIGDAGPTKVINLYGQAFPADQVFGVRIIVTTTDSTGVNKPVTVLINTTGETTLEALFAAANRFLAQGKNPYSDSSITFGQNAPRFTELGAAGIAAVVVGGYDGAVLQV